MTWAAPTDRTSSMLRVLHTPVTSAPNAVAICTAKLPTPPAAPLISTRCPARTLPTSRMARRAVCPAIVTAAACSKVSLAGLGTTRSASARAYSANEPSKRPSTSSPARTSRTFAPTASTTPAPSTPTTGGFGLVSPTTPMSRATYGSPRTMCQSWGLSAAAWTRTRTSSGPIWGSSMSTNRRTSGGPNFSWTIAFMTFSFGSGGGVALSRRGQFGVPVDRGDGAGEDRRGLEALDDQVHAERELERGDRERGKKGERGDVG